MKRKNILIAISSFFILGFLTVSCQKNLDINEDPNQPTEVPENLMLPSLLSNFSYEVVGGYPVRTTSLWTKQTAYAVDGAHAGGYAITASDVNNLWTYFSYSDVMNNAVLLKDQALENGNPHYSAIAKIILAWNLSIITDLFGDVPYSEAFRGSEGILKPKYDAQEDVYKSIQTLLSEAIEEANQDGGNLLPGGDDLVYGGNMDSWTNLAHTLKARFYLRLSNAPGYNAATQAQLALDELAKGSIDASTQPEFEYFSATGAENPWYQFAIDGKWNTATRPSQFYVNMLLDNNDPRLAYQATLVEAGDNVLPENVGTYKGVVNEAPTVNLANFSQINPVYSASDAPLYWLIYPEVEFIRAEALFLAANQTVTAQVIEAYESAIQASMDFYGINSAETTDYIQNNPLSTTAATAYRQIMTEKYVANYLMFETYNDFRRTGYPELTINNDTYPGVPLDQPPRINQIPVRFPYPSAELLYNAANIPAGISANPVEAIVVNVWWDAN